MEPGQTAADFGFPHCSGVARVRLLLGKRNEKSIIGLKIMTSLSGKLINVPEPAPFSAPKEIMKNVSIFLGTVEC